MAGTVPQFGLFLRLESLKRSSSTKLFTFSIYFSLKERYQVPTLSLHISISLRNSGWFYSFLELAQRFSKYYSSLFWTYVNISYLFPWTCTPTQSLVINTRFFFKNMFKFPLGCSMINNLFWGLVLRHSTPKFSLVSHHQSWSG